MHLGSEIEPDSDALGHHEGANLEMHSKVVIKQVWKCTGGHNQARLEHYLEEVNLEAVDWEGGAMALSICCTQCILYTVGTHDHAMERKRRMT